ncbi:uncharacterized protein LOC127001312 isoform X27 [Eriocheir sinensis]|uniref:uncharacterized protein LOC127001312 isoform X27 n=1 Tax=Eriocheir sinensis TaxID=95602 RepID=UPI0021CA3421|nr:uncharacterized protein LOC127001312 isoform X27 [Eriocheir sinensis]
MAGRVAVVVLLVVVFVGALCFSSAKDCFDPDVVVKEGEEKIIYQKNETQPRNATSISLYVKPGDDFEQVCIKVEDETLKEKAEECLSVAECNLNSTTWNLLEVGAEVVKDDCSGKHCRVKFNLTGDGCSKMEKTLYRSENITRLTVFADDASKWLLNGPPDPCPDTTTENPSSGWPSTSNTTTGNPSSGSPSTTVLTVIIVVILAAAVVGVIIWKRQRKLSGPQRVLRSIQLTSRRDTDTGYSGQVVENSLYEPLPGPVTPAARQEQPGTVQVVENSLCESMPGPVTPAATQEQPGTVQVIENSLCEPLPGPVTPAATQEQPGTVQVIENSLCEPLPGPVTPAARQEQPGTVQVIENSLCEPLPGPLTPAASQEP